MGNFGENWATFFFFLVTLFLNDAAFKYSLIRVRILTKQFYIELRHKMVQFVTKGAINEKIKLDYFLHKGIFFLKKKPKEYFYFQRLGIVYIYAVEFIRPNSWSIACSKIVTCGELSR